MGAHYERARLLSIQGRYEQAERELREDLAENPHNGQAHAFLGRCLAQQKRLKEAVAECEEGVHLAPHLAYAHYMLGLTYDDCGRLVDAEDALREALRLEPRNVGQLQWLSWVQYRRGDKHAALDTANQGLEIDPEHVNCLNSRGQYLRALGGWKDSEIAVRAALKLEPENAFTHANLGWTLWNKAHIVCGVRGWFRAWFIAWRGETREAHKHFLESLRLDPTSDWAKTGAADTLTARWTPIVQFTLALLIAAVAFLVWLAYSAEERFAPGSDAFPYAISVFLILAGGLTVVLARGPVLAAVNGGRLGSAVLSPVRRLAARATILCLALAAAAGLVGLFTPPPTAAAVLFVCFAVIRPVTVAVEADPGPVQRSLWAYAIVHLGACLILAASMGLTSGENRVRVSILLLVGGFVGSVFSEQIARDLASRQSKKTR